MEVPGSEKAKNRSPNDVSGTVALKPKAIGTLPLLYRAQDAEIVHMLLPLRQRSGPNVNGAFFQVRELIEKNGAREVDVAT